MKQRTVATRSILSRRHLPALTQFASSNVLLAFDYDGTLAPIAPTPAKAHMRPTTRRLLGRLAKRYPCVVISGRPLIDLARRLRNVPVWHLMGDHGFESWEAQSVSTAHVAQWVVHLREHLPAVKGVRVEEKRNSVTIHYRHVKNKQRVLPVLGRVVAQLQDARTIYGAEAINLLPRGGPDKGFALQQARRVFACDTAIYIGDDDTDEDAFVSGPADRLLTIRVGTRRPSAAQYRLRGQGDIDRFLKVLLELREKA